MLASGRCFLEDAEWGLHLEQGATRSLELHWAVDDFGNLNATARVQIRKTFRIFQ